MVVQKDAIAFLEAFLREFDEGRQIDRATAIGAALLVIGIDPEAKAQQIAAELVVEIGDRLDLLAMDVELAPGNPCFL